MKTVQRAYSIFVVLILVLGVFVFPAQAPSPVHAEDVVPAEPTQEPTQAPAEPPPAAPAVTAPASFSWDLTIKVTQEQLDALGSAEFDAFTKLTQNNVAYEVGDGTLKLSGTESLDQMRQAIFEDISPVVSFLGGQIGLNIISPVQQAQAMTVNMETRPATGFTWTLDETGTTPTLSQDGDPTITQRTPGLGASAFLSMSVASAEDGAASLAVRYNRPFEKEVNTYATLNINLPEFTPVVDVTDPVVESAALSVDETQISPEENLEENPLDQLTGLTEPLPTSFDWRNYGIVPDVRNQAACGSCFAFGTVGVMESAIKIAGGPLPDLSEQFIVSCNKNNWNCDNGGLTAHAYHYNTLGRSQTVVGAVLESDFPYSATNGSCTVPFSHPYKLSSWKFITPNEFTMPTVDQIKAAIWTYGPITAGVCAGDGWGPYSGGVYSTEEPYSTCYGGTNHQIILTGWDDSTQTWILRNSWGPAWGDGGYMHIKWNTSRVGEGTSWVKYGSGFVLPPAPALVSPVSGYISGSPNVNFQWSSVGSGIKYQIQIDDANTFATPLDSYIGATDELTYASDVLPQGTLYWRVRSIKFDHPGAWSTARSFIVDLSAPPKPNLLNPANGAGLIDTTPTLSVSAVTGAKYYDFQWDKAADFGTASNSDYQTATSFTVPTAKALPFGKYYWRAQAKDAAGNESGWSDPRWFNVTILKAPANGSFTTNTKPPFSWSAVPGALQYRLQVATDIDFISLALSETRPPSTSYIHPTALDFNNYYWRMQVETAPGVWGDWTPANQFTITPPPLPAPLLDSPANASYTNSPQPLFRWNPVSGAHYELWVDRQSGFTAPVDVVVSDLFGTSALPPTAQADGKYYWKVRSINYLGVPGAWSSVRYVTIDTVAPPLPVLSTPLNGAAVLTNVPTLAVKAVTGAKYYQFQWDDAPDFVPPLRESGLLTTTSYKLTTAQALPFGKVYWRAVSFDAAMNTSGATDSRWFNVTILKTPANGSYTTNTKPTFSWASVPGTALYQIEVADNPDFTSAIGITRPPSTSYTHSVPLAYGKYYWRMMVYTPAGDWSVYTPPNQFTVTPPLLKAPVLLSPASGAYTNDQYPDLSWNPVTDANPVTYEVWVDRQSGFTAPVDAIYAGVTTASQEVQIALADGKYYWKVRTVNYLDVPGAWSSTRSFTVDTIAPPAPALTAPANYAPGIYFTPTFSWGAATGANAYMFEYDNNVALDSPEFTSGALTTRTFLPTGMGVGTWYWHVKSRDAAGNWGAWSGYRTLEILPPAVKNGGFESGATNWYGYSAGWVSGFSHSGSNSGIIADPLSYYGGAWLGQSSVNMTYGLKYLHFWYHIESEDWCGYDQAGVFINTTLVKVYDLCYSRNTNGWAHQVIGLSGYAGQTINLEFDTLGDDSYWSDFYIDDVVISTSSATPSNVMVASAKTALPSRADILAGATIFRDEDNERLQQMKAILMQSIMRSRLHYSQVDRIQ